MAQRGFLCAGKFYWIGFENFTVSSKQNQQNHVLFWFACDMFSFAMSYGSNLVNSTSPLLNKTWVYIYARLHVGIVFAKLGLMHTLPHLTWVHVVFDNDNLRWQTMGLLLSIRWGF